MGKPVIYFAHDDSAFDAKSGEAVKFVCLILSGSRRGNAIETHDGKRRSVLVGSERADAIKALRDAGWVRPQTNMTNMTPVSDETHFDAKAAALAQIEAEFGVDEVVAVKIFDRLYAGGRELELRFKGDYQLHHLVNLHQQAAALKCGLASINGMRLAYGIPPLPNATIATAN